MMWRSSRLTPTLHAWITHWICHSTVFENAHKSEQKRARNYWLVCYASILLNFSWSEQYNSLSTISPWFDILTAGHNTPRQQSTSSSLPNENTFHWVVSSCILTIVLCSCTVRIFSIVGVSKNWWRDLRRGLRCLPHEDCLELATLRSIHCTNSASCEERRAKLINLAKYFHTWLHKAFIYTSDLKSTL